MRFGLRFTRPRRRIRTWDERCRPRTAWYSRDRMATFDTDALTDRELLALYDTVLDTLRARGTTRSANNPVADYAEGLYAKALKLELVGKSTTGYDGTDPAGKKIEIKARRITNENGSQGVERDSRDRQASLRLPGWCAV